MLQPHNNPLRGEDAIYAHIDALVEELRERISRIAERLDHVERLLGELDGAR